MNVHPSPFLTAEWRHLAMLSYEIDPRVLSPLVPAGTELDDWQGRTFVSVVGFLFQGTRVFGAAIPFHRDFEDVNLRFYVRRMASDGRRRGVVFVKEIVPRLAIALTARAFYGENYMAVPMRHRLGTLLGLRATKEGGARPSTKWSIHAGRSARRRPISIATSRRCTEANLSSS